MSFTFMHHFTQQRAIPMSPNRPLLLPITKQCHPLQTRYLSSRTITTYRPPTLTNIEAIETYRPGGFHPIHLYDTLQDNRYTILHKLGYGGFSTVWLARDKARNQFVSLKILTAEAIINNSLV